MVAHFILAIFLMLFASDQSNDIITPSQENLRGQWTLSNIGGLTCNVCPKIQFNENSTGSIIATDGSSQFFKYKVVDEKIEINSDQDIIIQSGEYDLLLNTTNEEIDILTMSNAGKVKYKLTRIKKNI